MAAPIELESLTRSYGERRGVVELDLTQRLKAMSKGNRQKLVIVQALMHGAPVLLPDEPSSGLDPLMAEVLLALLREERAAGRTVFLSSHILSEVEQIADRVGIIRDGRLVAVDTMEHLRSLRERPMEIRLSICALVIATDLALIVSARLIGESISAGGILALSVYLLLFPLTFGTFAAAVSSLSSSRGQAAGIAATALVLSYLIWVVSLISTSWSWIEHLSIFSLFHPQSALADASLSPGDVLALAIISLLCTGTSLAAFHRRPTV